MKKHIPKILIVDDDQLYLKQFSTILTKEIKADYYFSNNATEAFELINNNAYAIILLDVDMPEKSGFELAHDVRHSKLNENSPIIFITGISIDNQSVFEGYKVGAVDYLSKPVNKFILFSKIKTFLKLDSQKNELLFARDKLAESNRELQEKDIELKELNVNLEKLVDRRTKQLVKEIDETVKAKASLQLKAIQLEENYRFLETLIETIPMPIYYKNDKGEYMGCNKAFELHNSTKKEDIIGKTVYALATKKIADRITKIDSEIIKSGELRIREVKTPNKDGLIRNLILYKNQFHLPRSKNNGIIGAIVDVTELTRAKGLLNIQHTIDYLSSMEKGRKNIFNNILNTIIEFDWVDSAGIYILDDERQDLTMVSHKGLSKKFVNRSKFFPKDSVQTKLVMNKKPFYGLYKKLGDISGEEAQKENLKLLVVIPLIHDEEVIGSLNLASKSKEELLETEKKEIESLSSRIGNLIVYAQTQEKLKTYQKELEQKIKLRTEGLQSANLKLNKEIEIHKHTKTALTESEYKYRGIFENAQDGIVLYDAETLDLVEINSKAYKDLGYTLAEFKKMKYGEFVIYKDEAERKELVQQLFSKGKISFQAKHRKKNGEVLYRIVNASTLTINGKKYIQGIIHDITEIKEKEIELQISEKRYKDLQSNIPIGLWTTNLAGEFLYLNKAAKKILGHEPKKKVPNLSVFDVFYYTSERSGFIEQIQNTGYIKNKEMQFVRKDKVVFWGNISANAVYDNEQKLIRIDGVVEDITERKEVRLKLDMAYEKIQTINRDLEKKIENAVTEAKQQHQYMVQKSKIESLGELAAGIAHEINQPLGVMSLSLENLHVKITSNRATPKYVNEKFDSIETNIHRIRQIVDHIRTFSHEATSVSLEKVVVNKGISNALLLIGAQYQHHNIDIKLDLQENMGFTVGSKQKFEQVMLNLLSNAKYAVEECALDYTESEYQKAINITTNATEKRIFVSVEDNGIGIKPGNLTKVLDPFYTSKPEGIGTGLGLSIVYGIIKEMRGEIIIDSEWDKYTKVEISFPRFPEND